MGLFKSTKSKGRIRSRRPRAKWAKSEALSRAKGFAAGTEVGKGGGFCQPARRGIKPGDGVCRGCKKMKQVC